MCKLDAKAPANSNSVISVRPEWVPESSCRTPPLARTLSWQSFG
jgi:hypothetical protein